MKERQFLKGDICLCGESDGKRFKRTFTIVKRMDEGASSVCYEAYHERSGRGVLKEFYPKNAYALERDARGQLVNSAEFRDAHERFLKAKQEYLEPYEMLLQAKQNSGNQDLATFIPAFEIYNGCDEEGNIVGTVYIWTAEPKLETFDKVCEEIHKHPDKNPEHKLVTVLSAIETLTKCICALHSADMVHRDIKPSNFGFMKRGGETLAQTLSLFDINSVCSVYGKFEGAVGTEGYLEMEAKYESANNQTDIYSIGATLFHAIIVSDEAKDNGYLYQNDYYGKLHELVDGSRLIQASEANSHPRLRNILTTILQRCLCERTYRYASCEELLEDLEDALYYALPSEIARKSRSGEKWILADAEKSLDINREKNSSLVMQYHLYERTLYQALPKNETDINVLVIGFGNYGQKFLDTCLQTGQIRGKSLHVTVVSDDITDKEIYLYERPELGDFFDIDGSLRQGGDIYGTVSFEITKLARNDQKSNADILHNIMCEHYNAKPPHYVFIALGEDGLNYAAAKACRTVAEELGMNCLINYVCEEEQFPEEDSLSLCPVYVNRDVKKSALYAEIERMAYNTHLIWEKNLNLDYRVVRAEYRKPYNHDSCISSVLALKYKLYSIGIDLEKCSFDKAASLFKKLMSDKRNRSKKNELVWVEHRRWVTEKLCLGWHRIRNLEDCQGGVTKDEKNKRHVCIVRSRPEPKLATEYRNNYKKWDSASDSDLNQLDELDRMSVELHQMYAEKAKIARKQNLLTGSTMAGIRTLIEGERKAMVTFQEWYTCLKDIWNGDAEKVRLYKGFRNSFLNAAACLAEEKRQSIQRQVKTFDAVFYPILASMEYRDWKQDDVTFVDNIPFILSYSEDAYMVIPYATGDNTEVFGNVAAPTVVGPAKILYMYFIERKQDISELKKSIPYVIEYMRKKQFKASVEMIFIYMNSAASLLGDGFDKDILMLGGGRIKRIKHIRLMEIEDLSAELSAYLKQRRTGKRIFAVEKNSARISYMLQATGFYKSFPNYRFDSANMKFHSLAGCDIFSYIKRPLYITVTDMAAFKLSSSESSNQPEFFNDYKDLWTKYCDQRTVWKMLCDTLGGHAEKNDILVSFRKKCERDKETTARKYYYILPFVCSKSAAKIMDFLKEQGIAEQESRVSGYTSASCEVTVIDRCGYRAEYDRLFSQVYALREYDAINLYLNTKSHEVKVVFDNLVVSGVQLPGGRGDDFNKLLDYFRVKGYIIHLTAASDGKIGFTYATRQIKELLTTAGKMLEVYTYHKVRELGCFDDVVSSFEVDWEGTEAKSEFDCIITRGFRTLFVECKARPDIAQEYYFKLSSQARQFGINATAVLVADTQEKGGYDNAPVNAMQRKRGSMMDVVTVWKQEEINNIGHTLLKVISGTYEGEER